MKRTKDQISQATNQFFDDNDLNGAAVAYFAAPFIQGKIDEGHKCYNSMLDAAEEDIPDGADVLLGKVLEMYTYTRETYEQKVSETFKEKFRETFILASIYVPMSHLMKDLLNKPEDENLLALLMEAMDDVMETMIRRIEIIVKLCLETGMPLKIAKEIADKIGADDVVFGMVEVIKKGNGDESDDDNSGCDCSGECGGRCDCKERTECEENGHCQCD